jgi:hypothetical protein
MSGSGPTKVPAKPGATQTPAPASARGEIDAFLKQAASLTPAVTGGKRGRLVFALDATMSRQPTWDTACALQGEMFKAAGETGGLDIQLVYFRSIAECRASAWVSSTDHLTRLMSQIDCRGGHTQIVRALDHVTKETEREKVQALVYVGDAMEEPFDDICAAAGRLALRGVPAFVFQEGHDAVAEPAFREIARLTKGAYARFDAGSAAQLAELLKAVAVYASGGRKALLAAGERSRGAQLLIGQMR